MKKLGKQEKSRDPFSCHWQIKRSDFPNCRCWPSYRQINIKSFNKWSSQSPQSLVTRHNDRRTESCFTTVSDVISLKLSPSQPVLLKRVSYEVTITLLSLSSTSLCISFFDVLSLYCKYDLPSSHWPSWSSIVFWSHSSWFCWNYYSLIDGLLPHVYSLRGAEGGRSRIFRNPLLSCNLLSLLCLG